MAGACRGAGVDRPPSASGGGPRRAWGQGDVCRHTYTDVPMPPPFPDAHLTRADLEQLIVGPFGRTAELTAATIREAGITPDTLTAIFLVGGSSRIPMVARLVHERTGVMPTTLDQPETVVARGALLAVTLDQGGPGPPSDEITEMDVTKPAVTRLEASAPRRVARQPLPTPMMAPHVLNTPAIPVPPEFRVRVVRPARAQARGPWIPGAPAWWKWARGGRSGESTAEPAAVAARWCRGAGRRGRGHPVRRVW